VGGVKRPRGGRKAGALSGAGNWAAGSCYGRALPFHPNYAKRNRKSAASDIPTPKAMKKSYDQILKQIETLKAEAEEARQKEVGEVIERIRTAIAHYGLTAADLGLARGPGRPKGSGRAAAGAATKTRRARRAGGAGKAASNRAVKYRDDQGRSWVGRGKRPQWLRDALAGGKKLEDFAVK
jgi:DNA-binding protein H-NS